MSSYINWGNETPEQLADRRRREQEEITLWEQAVNARTGQAPIAAPGAAGGSSVATSAIASTAVFISSDIGKSNYQINSVNFSTGRFRPTIDSEINIEYYYLDNSYVIQNKGYLFLFRGNENYNDYAMLFTGAEGNILTIDFGTTSDLTTDYSKGDWIYAYDWDARILWYSNGITVIRDTVVISDTDSFEIGANGYVDSSTIGLGVYTRRLTSSPAEWLSQYYIIPSTTMEPTLVISDSEESSNIQFNYVLSAQASSIIKERYNGDTGEWLSLTMYDSTGIELNTIDLTSSPGAYLSRDRYQYGNGKILYIFYNYSDSEVDYLVVQYDMINGVYNLTTHNRIDYPDFNVITTGTNYPGDWRNSAISENVLISFYNFVSSSYSMETVNGCDFITIIGNQSPVLYTFDAIPSDSNKSINFSNISATTASFFIPCDTGDSMISILALGGSHSQEFNSLGSPGYSVLNYYTSINSTGDRTLLRIIEKDSPYATDLLVFNTDSFTQLGSTLSLSNDAVNLSYEFDTIRVKNTYDSVTNNWYFKRNSTDWVLFDTLTQWRSTRLFYQGTTVNRPGNLLFFNEDERIYWFNDVADNGNDINDGGDDMYDGGNRISTNLGDISYTHTQMTENDYDEAVSLVNFSMDGTIYSDPSSNFGSASSYFTNLYPGLFVLSVDSPGITEFNITGGLGSDSGNDGGDYDDSTIVHNGTTYTYFWKREWTNTDNPAEEPNVNHLIIVDSTDPDILHEASDYNDDNDDDRIFYDAPGNLPITKLHYLVFSKWNRVKVTNTELQNIVTSYLSIVDPVGTSISFAQTLTALNANYANVTSNLPPHVSSISTLLITPTLANSFSILGRDTIRVGKEHILTISTDPQREGKITIRLYNFSGTLLRAIRTNEYIVDSSFIVGTRILVITTNKGYDGTLEEWYYEYNIYKISNAGVNHKKVKVSTDVNRFETMLNDFTWYYDL